METITDVSRCKAGKGTRIGSFKNDAKAISGEHLVPRGDCGCDEPARCRGGPGIAIDEFVPRRQASRINGRYPRSARGECRQKGPEIEQRIADRGQFPIDDGRQTRFVVAEHDVAKMKIAMNDAGLPIGWSVGVEPVPDFLDEGDCGAGIVRGVAVRREV